MSAAGTAMGAPGSGRSARAVIGAGDASARDVSAGRGAAHPVRTAVAISRMERRLPVGVRDLLDTPGGSAGVRRTASMRSAPQYHRDHPGQTQEADDQHRRPGGTLGPQRRRPGPRGADDARDRRTATHRSRCDGAAASGRRDGAPASGRHPGGAGGGRGGGGAGGGRAQVGLVKVSPIGCRWAQGYHFHRLLRAEDFEAELLASHSRRAAG